MVTQERERRYEHLVERAKSKLFKRPTRTAEVRGGTGFKLAAGSGTDPTTTDRPHTTAKGRRDGKAQASDQGNDVVASIEVVRDGDGRVLKLVKRNAAGTVIRVVEAGDDAETGTGIR
ncbi:hypothetical protein ABZ419_09790 [Streptomyces cinnamoneus]|uniref:hypothetical protein n=1 Tax=Streptomyces cinnamoneus TaxID=53446 RepID=UPI0033C0053D